MKRKTMLVIMSVFMLVLLAACNKSVEERAEETMKTAMETFDEKAKEPKEKVASFEMYIPDKIEVEDEEDEQNIILYKGKQPFILFVNPNEEDDSELFYNVLKDAKTSSIIEEETYEEDGVFGFAAVLESDDSNVELIANLGGKKMTTITKNKHMTTDMKLMIEMLNSIE